MEERIIVDQLVKRTFLRCAESVVATKKPTVREFLKARGHVATRHFAKTFQHLLARHAPVALAEEVDYSEMPRRILEQGTEHVLELHT